MSQQGRLPVPKESTVAWDAFIAAEIDRFVRQFQGIEIVVGPDGAAEAVSVPVHAPYMQRSVFLIQDEERFARLAPRHRERLKRVKAARDSATAEVKAFLERQFYGADRTEPRVARGRAEWEDIRALLQAAVGQGLVPAGKGRSYPDGHDLRQWLVTYGIGVDCSAFVQQALARLMQACHAAVRDSPCQRYLQSVGWLSSTGVYRDVTGQSRQVDRFTPVSTPVEARPGDVLVKQGHVRIVAGTAIDQGDGFILRLAESTSAADVPSGLAAEEPDIGPRLIEVKYPEPQLAIREQMPLRKRLRDYEYRAEREESEYILGRLRALDRLCRQHTPFQAPAVHTIDAPHSAGLGKESMQARQHAGG